MKSSARKSSPLAAALVRRVFSVYVTLALGLTTVQIALEYRDTYKQVLHELDSIARAFKPGITDALWNYQEPLLRSIASGMVDKKIAVGVHIVDVAQQISITLDGTDYEPLDSGLSKRVELRHQNSKREEETIGYMTLYSSHRVVFERVQYSVMLIVINAAIKTAGLWLIIMYFANRLLAGPLRRFTRQIGEFDLTRAKQAPRIDLGDTRSDELVYLRDAFDDLAKKVVGHKQALNELTTTLEKRVAERTAELHDKNRALAAEQQQTAAANIAKSRFLAAASHDLSQPMHALNLYLGSLGSMDLSPEARSELAKIQQCGQAMNEMFSALLDISQLDAGAIAPQIRAFPIQTVLDRIQLEFEPLARAKGLSLNVLPCAAFVRSDPMLVERIAGNLVANAVRYTARGVVIVGCRRRGRQLRFSVYDTGPGIPVDKQRAVFEEFYQLNNPGHDRSQGLGLGLAIVDRLAQLLNIPVTLRSAVGRGSLFAIDLPRAAPQHAVAADALVPTRNRGELKGAQIVVVEDDAAILDATRSILQRWGCEVITASSTSEAIRKLATSTRVPDALICDYRLSDTETGVDAVERIRMEFNHDIPALFITGEVNPAQLQQFREDGLTVLHKPLHEKTLGAALLQLIEHHDEVLEVEA